MTKYDMSDNWKMAGQRSTIDDRGLQKRSAGSAGVRNGQSGPVVAALTCAVLFLAGSAASAQDAHSPRSILPTPADTADTETPRTAPMPNAVLTPDTASTPNTVPTPNIVPTPDTAPALNTVLTPKTALAPRNTAFSSEAVSGEGHAAAKTDPSLTEPRRSAASPVVLTLDEALQIALVKNYAIRSTRLDLAGADAQIREAWGQVMPQIDVTSSYTRNLKSANPFAGSEAGGLFSSFGFIDWLSYNENARTDEDPATEPISFDEFGDRQREGLDEIGATFGGSDNPFAVPNEFIAGVSVEQTLFSGSAFKAIKAASRLKDINRRALDRQEQILIDNVRRSFFTALLAQEQADVQRESVLRTAKTLEDVTKRVSQGVVPKFERLSAEVELTNLETQLVQVRNQASESLDALKMQLGVPIEQPIRLRGSLEAQDQAVFMNVSIEDAVDEALTNRPDLAQARLAVELRQIDRDISKSQYLPAVTAFANLNYMGRVPDDRSFIRGTDDPFTFTQHSNNFFSKAYWNPSVNAGIRLTWNVFNGFQTSARVQQKQVAIDQARVDYDEAYEAVHLEVGNALRNLEAARLRIESQEQNVARAELNYEYAQQRLSEGVATHLEERNASEQLDLSRLNYLQAVHDFLVARSAFQTAIGKPLTEPSRLNLTSN